jgi:hypothetical protein
MARGAAALIVAAGHNASGLAGGAQQRREPRERARPLRRAALRRTCVRVRVRVVCARTRKCVCASECKCMSASMRRRVWARTYAVCARVRACPRACACASARACARGPHLVGAAQLGFGHDEERRRACACARACARTCLRARACARERAERKSERDVHLRRPPAGVVGGHRAVHDYHDVVGRMRCESVHLLGDPGVSSTNYSRCIQCPDVFALRRAMFKLELNYIKGRGAGGWVRACARVAYGQRFLPAAAARPAYGNGAPSSLSTASAPRGRAV